MYKRLLFLFLAGALTFQACGTLDVSIEQNVNQDAPAAEATQSELSIAATSMSAFVTQQAGTMMALTAAVPSATQDPLNPWKSYQNQIFGFSMEYPLIYDSDPYNASCGLKESNEAVRFGQRSELLFLYTQGMSLEEYIDNQLASRDWRIESREETIVSGLPAIKIDYRFGGTNRFGTTTLVEYHGLIYAFQFTAGDFCEIPGYEITEPEAYEHMIETFKILYIEPSPTPPAAADQVRPILVFPPYDSRSGFLLGGSRQGEWLDSIQTAALMGGNEEYALYVNDVLLGSGIGSLPQQKPPFCPSMQEVALNGDDTFKSTVGLSPAWNALPRQPEQIPTDNEIYRQIMAEYLRENGIFQPQVILNRVLKVDLEGDGLDEILISASNFTDQTGHDVSAGDYSVILVRRLAGNNVVSKPLVAEYNYRARASAFPDKHTLMAVLDINGDGRMEIVIGITGWERTGAMAFEITGEGPEVVLWVRCPE